MLHYLLILLLINTYGQSLGTPVIDRGTDGKILIANLLSDLSKRCKNVFVSGQIDNRIKECNVTTPPFYDIEMECMVFHDASSLLCNISSESFPNLEADFKTKMSSKLTADEFCTEAARFDLLPTTFRKYVSRVFQGDSACKKVCMDKDVLSGNTNFVCKYYKWSMEILQSTQTALTNSSTLRNGVSVSGTENAEDKPSESVTTNTTSASGVQVNGLESNVRETSSINVQNEQQQSNIESSSNGVTTSVLNRGSSNHSQAHEETSQQEDNHGKPQPTPQTGHDLDNGGEGNVDTGLNQELSGIAHNGQGVDNVIDNPGDIDDIGKDGIDADDDSDDPDVDLDIRHSQQAPKTQKNPNRESSHGGFLPNISEGYTEDDDHFFPFFLTVVIIVIILYILYHNKSKVGKMFFGLIVEGRQSGRRRNSRGHSYRRLDTLEQAMGANAPAPPSKIIY